VVLGRNLQNSGCKTACLIKYFGPLLASLSLEITRAAELVNLPTPPATATHIPIPHAAVVGTLVETLGHRHIGVVDEEFAGSSDAMEMFGVLDLEPVSRDADLQSGFGTNKRFQLACTIGLRVFVCHNLALQPGLSKTREAFLARRRPLDRG